MDNIFTFDDHIKSPEISVSQYIQTKCIELSRSVNEKKIIYFDTNFWVTMRDVALGSPECEKSKEFYRKVMNLAETGQFIFPISEVTLLEVMKQSDPKTLCKTIDLIDKLSLGVSLINFEERLELEIKHFLYSKTGAEVYKRQEMVWTRLAYNKGFITPSNSNIDKDTDRAIQKAFIDQMWVITLADMINTLKENGGIPDTSMPKMASKLNEGKFSHTSENNTFKQMFLSELAGTLDGCRDVIATCSEAMYERKTGRSLSESEKQNTDTSEWLRILIYNLFKLNKAKDFFPTLEVNAGLHAAIRWNKSQKYKDNDLPDIMHSAAALPYCDAFFTDGPCAHLISQTATGYDKKYSCDVASSVPDALKVLNQY